MHVSVLGLGKVGLGLAACLRAAGHDVVGVDADERRVREIRARTMAAPEPGLLERLWGDAGSFDASADVSDAVHRTRVTFVVVPTPSDAAGGFSLHHALTACDQVGRALRTSSSHHVVALVSTILPGASRGEIVPALEAASGKRIGEGVSYCYNPAFIALGDVINGFERPDFVLIGEATPRCGDAVERVHRSMMRNSAAVIRLDPVEIEIAKIASNTHDACRVAFANMLLAACSETPGADVDRVTDALAHRIGRRFLRGAVPFGGPCWPRDNVAMTAFLDRLNAPSGLPQAVQQMNADHGRYILDKILRLSGPRQRVGLLGLSYKPGTPVLDEAFGIQLARWLADADRDVIVWDPLAQDEARGILGDSVRYAGSAQACLAGATLVVLANPIASSVDWSAGAHATVVDCWRCLSAEDAARVATYVALGRGAPVAERPRDPVMQW